MDQDAAALALLAVRTLAIRDLRLATSESLTGGGLGAAITSVPGSSAVYLGGVIAYATPMKRVLSGVPAEVLAMVGPISGLTAAEMAFGVQRLTGADWAIATTGVAGPEPQGKHPVGEVWICVVGPRVGTVEPAVQAVRLDLVGDREQIRRDTVTAALRVLVTMLSPV
ncbi:MAG: CinA family protein [Micropruina sp.]|nr:CinA family protein [Micropruina sp.]